MESVIQTLAIYAIPVVFAITLHEAAHGYVARHFGDPTAWMLGRISLNPLRHVDPVGTVLVPAITMALGGILFGWAKPVPVMFGKLRHPKKDMLWVAAAGPGANLLMLLGWAVSLKVALVLPEHPYSEAIREMSRAGIRVTSSLMLLNLLPIPPLDGGRMAVSLLPMSVAVRFSRLEPYGFWILLAMIFFTVNGVSILGYVMYPAMGIVEMLVKTILSL